MADADPDSTSQIHRIIQLCFIAVESSGGWQPIYLPVDDDDVSDFCLLIFLVFAGRNRGWGDARAIQRRRRPFVIKAR